MLEYGLEQVGKELEKLENGKFRFYPEIDQLDFRFNDSNKMFVVDYYPDTETYLVTYASDYEDDSTYIEATIVSDRNAESDAKKILEQYKIISNVVDRRISELEENFSNSFIGISNRIKKILEE